MQPEIDEAAPMAVHFAWRVVLVCGLSQTVTYSPEAGGARVRRDYPGATVEPLPGSVQGQRGTETGELLELEFVPEKSCRSCVHAARPGLENLYCGGRDDLPPAYGRDHPLRRLPEDGGVSCGGWQDEQP